jgi:hypothetical protein
MRGKSANDRSLRPICSICGQIYKGYGNNAYPINQDRCCDQCNQEKVLPQRIHLMHLHAGEGRKKDLEEYKKLVQIAPQANPGAGG